jgi:histidinol-phosphate phosphatase family protein
MSDQEKSYKSPLASWLRFRGVDSSWTLFLDRDGVINLHLPGDYVKKVDEFIFLEGVLEAISALSEHFGKIIIVTNQQGVGKGLMSLEDLQQIHDFMLKNIQGVGGRIDAVYAATELVENDIHSLRKPKTGMAFQAKTDFPEIDFSRSVMVGDSITDMKFGKGVGMITIYKTTENSNPAGKLCDYCLSSLTDLLEKPEESL